MSLPTRVLLYQKMRGKFHREEQLLADHAESLNIPIYWASEKMMERGRLKPELTDLVAGSVPFVLHALRHLGVEAPLDNSYPVVLRSYLQRQVRYWARLMDVQAYMAHTGATLFVKPAQRIKSFTGFVTNDPSDYLFFGTSKRQPAWTSEVVKFVSEWRVYVAYGKILEIRLCEVHTAHYVQNHFTPAPVDEDIIRSAVADLTASGEALDGYVIDFGVTVEGKTLLIESNDGFSVGTYGDIGAKNYWDVIWARWQQLLKFAIKE